MHWSLRKHPLRGSLYHLSLLTIVGSSFNWGFERLTGINIIGRIFEGVIMPDQWIAVGICVAAVIVLWNNWVD